MFWYKNINYKLLRRFVHTYIQNVHYLLVTDRVPEIGIKGKYLKSAEKWVLKVKLNLAFLHFFSIFYGIFDVFSKFYRTFGRTRLWKIIKCANKFGKKIWKAFQYTMALPKSETQVSGPDPSLSYLPSWIFIFLLAAGMSISFR